MSKVGLVLSFGEVKKSVSILIKEYQGEGQTDVL